MLDIQCLFNAYMGDMEVYTFSECISPKVNVIPQPDFELVNYDAKSSLSTLTPN